MINIGKSTFYLNPILKCVMPHYITNLDYAHFKGYRELSNERGKSFNAFLYCLFLSEKIWVWIMLDNPFIMNLQRHINEMKCSFCLYITYIFPFTLIFYFYFFIFLFFFEEGSEKYFLNENFFSSLIVNRSTTSPSQTSSVAWIHLLQKKKKKKEALPKKAPAYMFILLTSSLIGKRVSELDPILLGPISLFSPE